MCRPITSVRLAAFVNMSCSATAGPTGGTPMRHALATLMIGAIVVAAGYVPDIEAAQQSGTTGTRGPAKAVVPPPVAVEVIAVDPTAKTITVRDIVAVPATPD